MSQMGNACTRRSARLANRRGSDSEAQESAAQQEAVAEAEAEAEGTTPEQEEAMRSADIYMDSDDAEAAEAEDAHLAAFTSGGAFLLEEGSEEDCEEMSDDDSDDEDEDDDEELEDAESEDEEDDEQPAPRRHSLFDNIINSGSRIIWHIRPNARPSTIQARRARQTEDDTMQDEDVLTPDSQQDMNNDLALTMRRASDCCNSQCPTTPEADRRMSTNQAGVETMNTSMFLWERQCNASGDMRSWSKPQRRHMYGFHYMPNRPISLRDKMNSRAYIGQYSHDGDYFIAAFQSDRRIRVYDTNNDWVMKKDVYARNLRWTVTDVSLTSDQQFLVYSSLNPSLHMLNVKSGGVNSEANVTEVHEALHLDETDSDGPAEQNKLPNFGIFSVKWSHDSQFLCAGTGSGPCLIVLFDVEKQKTVQTLEGHDADVNAVCFMDETCNIIASGSDDYAIRIWDKRDPTGSSGALLGHVQGLTYLDPKGDGRYLLSNSKDQTAKIWDIRKMISESEYQVQSEVDLPYSNSHWDYSYGQRSTRGVKHPHDCSIQTLRGHTVSTTLIRAHWSPMHTTGQRFVYTGSSDGHVYIYDAITSKIVDKLRYRKRGCNSTVIRDVSWHPTRASLVASGFDGSLVEFVHSPDSLLSHLNCLPSIVHESPGDSHYW